MTGRVLDVCPPPGHVLGRVDDLREGKRVLFMQVCAALLASRAASVLQVPTLVSIWCAVGARYGATPGLAVLLQKLKSGQLSGVSVRTRARARASRVCVVSFWVAAA
jgi:hypothetical protein